MVNFLIQYWDSVLVVILFVMVIMALLKRGAIKQVNEMLFYLVTEAEAQFGGEIGRAHV